MKKLVQVDERATKEIEAFPREVQIKIWALVVVLGQDGYLKEPYAKRIDHELFEVRIKYQGQWRAIYAYIKQNEIVVLSAFNKKTQKTPPQEIKKAQHRLQEYL